MPVIAWAQDLNKEEKKALKAELRAEKKEQKRIQDSVWKAEQAEHQRALIAEMRKKESTSLLIITPYDTQKEVFDLLVQKMMQKGNVPEFINEEYYIIRTARRQVFSSTYDITFTVFKEKGKVCVRGAGVGYGSFGISSGMFRSNTDMIVPLVYGSKEGSTAKTAWNEIEFYLLNLTHEEAIYELPK